MIDGDREAFNLDLDFIETKLQGGIDVAKSSFKRILFNLIDLHIP